MSLLIRRTWRPPDNSVPHLTVPSLNSPERIDLFLSRASNQTRGSIQRALDLGIVFVNGKRVEKSSTKLRGGEVIDYDLPAPLPSEIKGENLPLDVLYEDNDLAVINKPAGQVVHPAAGHWEGTLANALAYHFKKLAGESIRPGIVHRLDKDTSGILLIAKTETARESLMKQFKDREIKKIYQVLVRGKMRVKQGTIDQPIGRNPKHRKKMAVVSSGRAAITHYKIIQQFEDFTLLECAIETGRTHQIRVHLSSIGHPVAGDSTYGKKDEKLRVSRQLLHAWKIAFRHPISKEPMCFEAPLPEDFRAFVDRAPGPASPSRLIRRSG